MDDPCKHKTLKGREGEKGYWCVDCGIKAMEVHDRPCGECTHYFNSVGYHGCRRHLMAVHPTMLVTYYVVDGPGRSGLCFEEPHNG